MNNIEYRVTPRGAYLYTCVVCVIPSHIIIKIRLSHVFCFIVFTVKIFEYPTPRGKGVLLDFWISEDKSAIDMSQLTLEITV